MPLYYLSGNFQGFWSSVAGVKAKTKYVFLTISPYHKLNAGYLS